MLFEEGGGGGGHRSDRKGRRHTPGRADEQMSGQRAEQMTYRSMQRKYIFCSSLYIFSTLHGTVRFIDFTDVCKCV